MSELGGKQKGPRPHYRMGKMQLASHYDFEDVRQLKTLAFEQGVSQQDLMNEALHLLLAHYGAGQPAEPDEKVVTPDDGAAKVIAAGRLAQAAVLEATHGINEVMCATLSPDRPAMLIHLMNATERLRAACDRIEKSVVLMQETQSEGAKE